MKTRPTKKLPIRKKLSLTRLALLLAVIVPAASWALVKPVRVVAPALAGVSCPNTHICLDDGSLLETATALYKEANRFVSNRLGLSLHEPRVVFCSTQACADSFGLGDRSAVTVGTVGTVIGPHAWAPHYVRHELIHQLQAERLGVMSLLLKPSWFVEGMAYALSDDPRPTLTEPWQGYRARFKSWHSTIGTADIWIAAGEL